MSIENSGLEEIMRRIPEELDIEAFDKGYESASDPEHNAYFSGKVHGDKYIGPVNVSVKLDADLIDWLRERDQLQYIDTHEDFTQSIRDSSFVIGSLVAAIEQRLDSEKAKRELAEGLNERVMFPAPVPLGKDKDGNWAYYEKDVVSETAEASSGEVKKLLSSRSIKFNLEHQWPRP